ncbi:MAG: chloride channel protein [Chloroflexi bacterium]|nr:chloride channel protein [Chloroflexota bacterium]
MNRRPKAHHGVIDTIRSLFHVGRIRPSEMAPGMRYLRKWMVLGVLIGVVAGLGAFAFHHAIQFVSDLALGQALGFFPPSPHGEGSSEYSGPSRWWLIPAITTAGGLLAGIIVFKLAPEAEGHGTDAAIEAYHRKDGKVRWHVPFVKLVASAITIGSGGSAGREGPTAQIGGGFGSFLAQILHLSTNDRRIALAAGMGAGIGAIFKAPLGGAILASEIMYLQGLEVQVLFPTFIATLVGYTVFASLTDFTPVFGSGLDITFNDPISLIFYAVLGLACGVGGILYARSFYAVHRVFQRWNIKPWIKPAIGGLIVGLIALGLPQVLGMGYGWVQIAMSPVGLGLSIGMMILIILAKIVATSFSVGSGGSGGVFAPGVVIGGLIGATVWQTFHFLGHTPTTAAPFVIVGMTAFFGAIGHAPLAMIVMIAEMTGTYTLLPPAMIAVGIATVVVGRHSLYHSQVSSPVVSPVHRLEYSLLHNLKVWEAMKANVITVSPDDTIEHAAGLVRERSIKGLPVLDSEGKLVGIIANLDIVQIPHEKWDTELVEDHMVTELAVAHANDSLDDALQLMRQLNIGRLPIVDNHDASRLVGIITTSDIVDAYHDQRGGSSVV